MAQLMSRNSHVPQPTITLEQQNELPFKFGVMTRKMDNRWSGILFTKMKREIVYLNLSTGKWSLVVQELLQLLGSIPTASDKTGEGSARIIEFLFYAWPLMCVRWGMTRLDGYKSSHSPVT